MWDGASHFPFTHGWGNAGPRGIAESFPKEYNGIDSILGTGRGCSLAE
jgi:hypothetical protein